MRWKTLNEYGMRVSSTVLIDTSVLVALIDKQDKWHAQAKALEMAFAAGEYELVYADCVFAEAVSVMGRRAEEQKRSSEFDPILAVLLEQAPPHRLLWLLAEAERLVEPILTLVRSTAGQLGFNDALIALVCQELGISLIASYDKDFDRVPWFHRMSHVSELH